MTENHTTQKNADQPMTPRKMCRLIQAENTNPWNWLYPAASECASCVIMTGGHPEMMANFCPKVNQRLEELEQAEQDAVESPPEERDAVESPPEKRDAIESPPEKLAAIEFFQEVEHPQPKRVPVVSNR